MSLVRRGKVDVVACFKLDRLGRSLPHLAQIISELDQHGVALVAASGWAWDRADYNVVFKSGKVVEYGTGEVRVKQNAVVIVPLVVR
jgi:Resolvase, N terminal domain